MVYAEEVWDDGGELDLDGWLSLAEAHAAATDDVLALGGEAELRDARRFRHAVPAHMNERGASLRAAGGRKLSTDWAVPYRRLPEAIAGARALADRGGVMGIFQINPYIGAKERNTLDDFVAHIDHAVKVAGAEHVGIGSDREHRRIPDTPEEKQKLIDELSRLRPVNAASFRWPFFIAELNHPRRMETIADALAKKGYKADTVDKILGRNFYRLLQDTIG
jgi:hypothetical protein